MNQRINLLIFLICLLLGTGQTFAQTFNGTISAPSKLLNGKVPEANWIWDSGEDNPTNYYLMVRKTINLKQTPDKAMALPGVSKDKYRINKFEFVRMYQT